jgi:SET domain
MKVRVLVLPGTAHCSITGIVAFSFRTTTTMSSKEEETGTTTVNHDIVFPAFTKDYRLSTVKVGMGIVANRKIKKGQPIMLDSFEYMFGDVQEGDRLLLSRRQEASKTGGIDLPTHMPLTREILLETHGIPVINQDLSTDDEVVVSWHLQVPGMLMNHSCDPTLLDGDDNESYATCDLEKGDEITVDYCLEFYDRGPFFEKCLCGMAKCRGSMMGFKALSDAEKEEMLPKVTDAVKAMYLADIGKGPKVKEELLELPPRIHNIPAPTLEIGDKMKPMRIVFPGPSSALANVSVKKCNDGDEGEGGDNYALYASKDVAKGDMFYEFWWEEWPQGGKAVIDMAFASHLMEGDPQEGTVIRFDPRKSAAYRTAEGTLMFSGWQLLTAHSIKPNLVYRNKEKYEGDSWQCVFAAKNIKKGDLITMDWNCFIWDRRGSETSSGEYVLECGSAATKQGFKYLSPEAQRELKAMTWLHEIDPEVIPDAEPLCKALSPHVRASLVDPKADEIATSSTWSDSEDAESDPDLL